MQHEINIKFEQSFYKIINIIPAIIFFDQKTVSKIKMSVNKYFNLEKYYFISINRALQVKE